MPCLFYLLQCIDLLCQLVVCQQLVQSVVLAMACCKNVSGPAASAGGSPGGDGGGDPPRRLSAAEKGKGKKLATKKRKASDREAEVAEAVAAVAEAAERVGLSGALRIGADLTPRQRRAVLKAEARHGSPPGTIMIGGQRVRINVRDPA